MKALAEWGVFTPDDSFDTFLKQVKPDSIDTRRKESSSTTASGASQVNDPTLLTFPQFSSKQHGAKAQPEQDKGDNSSLFEDSSSKESTNNVWPESALSVQLQEKQPTVASPSQRASRAPKRQIYDRVDTEKRKRLLYLVDEMGVSIKGAAKQLQINYSTAKTILQLYRKSGRIERLPHHKSFKAKADLKVRIFNPYHGACIETERRAKIIHKEKQGFFVSKVKCTEDDDNESFCTQILLDIARGDHSTDEIGSPTLPYSGAQSAFSFISK